MARATSVIALNDYDKWAVYFSDHFPDLRDNGAQRPDDN